ncbi:hypothetical protein ACVWWO_009537 [Bradyrhizobium sp. F1.13.1]
MSSMEMVDVFHITQGRTRMLAIDAAQTVGQHPMEWSYEIWTPELLERVQATVKRNSELNSVPVVGALEPEKQP